MIYSLKYNRQQTLLVKLRTTTYATVFGLTGKAAVERHFYNLSGKIILLRVTGDGFIIHVDARNGKTCIYSGTFTKVPVTPSNVRRLRKIPLC